MPERPRCAVCGGYVADVGGPAGALARPQRMTARVCDDGSVEVAHLGCLDADAQAEVCG